MPHGHSKSDKRAEPETSPRHARSKPSKLREHDQPDGELTEYRGRESYEQQSPEGRGGQSGMFDQQDYPPRQLAGGEEPTEDDGHLVTPEDRLPSIPPDEPSDEPHTRH